MIDLCIVATLRPELLYRTMKSFYDNIKYDFGKMNVVMNIDLVPESVDPKITISKLIDSLYADRKETLLLHNFQCTFGIGNFAKAVKTVWENTTSDYVFHLEDDWQFLREIDIDWCIYNMKANNFDYLRFPKIGAAHLNCLHKVALQPSLWKGDVVRAITKEMDITKDPEKQLRTGQGNGPLDAILFDLQRKWLMDYGDVAYCKDIGREWRHKQGLAKWNKNKGNKEITWQKV